MSHECDIELRKMIDEYIETPKMYEKVQHDCDIELRKMIDEYTETPKMYEECNTTAT